jgi:hypothetical protein
MIIRRHTEQFEPEGQWVLQRVLQQGRILQDHFRPLLVLGLERMSCSLSGESPVITAQLVRTKSHDRHDRGSQVRV